jgi:hypothetical protein
MSAGRRWSIKSVRQQGARIPMENDPTQFLSGHPQLFIRQKKEWAEILTDWETSNRYTVMDAEQSEIGFIAEKSGGFAAFLKRMFLRSHRPFEIHVFDHAGKVLLTLTRGFFFFFSDLEILGPNSKLLGNVRRRFGVLYKKYDLVDEYGHTFARIEGPRWRLWTFPVTDVNGPNRATIAKKWGGALREIFSDADTFMIDFENSQWTDPQRTVIFAAAISIDFDFFEDNQRD